jgi:hypothetical protein
MTKLIVLTDVIETKLRKEKELEFYQRELEKLQQKMFFLRKDIEITNLCIQIIEQEKVLDVREQMQAKLLWKKMVWTNTKDKVPSAPGYYYTFYFNTKDKQHFYKAIYWDGNGWVNWRPHMYRYTLKPWKNLLKSQEMIIMCHA